MKIFRLLFPLGHVSERRLVAEAFVWLAMPTFLFIVGWLRWLVAIPLGGLLAVAIVKRLSEPQEDFHTPCFRTVAVDRRYWICFALLAFLTVMSGVGALVAQHPGDHVYRNAIFYDLARRSWPVTYEPVLGEPVTLCYYFGFWLPPALIAKLTGKILPGDIAQCLYAFWGMWIFFRFLFSRFGGRATWIAFLAPLGFAAWDVVIGALATWLLPFRLEWKLIFLMDLASEYYSLPPLTVLLFYIYNQGVGALVAFALLWHERSRPGLLLLLYSLLLILAPYPAIGIFPLMASCVLGNLRGFMTWQNFLGIIVAVIVALFFSGNAAHSASGFIPLKPGVLLSVLAIFLPFSYGVWAIGLWPWLRRNRLFWWTALPAILLPLFISSPGHQDIGYRITLPSMLVMIVAEIMALRNWKSLAKWRRAWLAVVIVVSCYTPLQALVQTADRNIMFLRGEVPAKAIWMMGKLDNPVADDCRTNFVIDGNTFFTRYLMRGEEREEREERV